VFGTALPSGDHPVDAVEVEAREWAEQGLQGQEPSSGRDPAQETSGARHRIGYGWRPDA
jgi:hypothetical protein